MTTQLSSLRVAADMNASNYVAGAKAVANANAQIVSTGAAAGATVTTTNQKVAAAGDVWTRLSRQYVEGASQAQRMQGALRTLQRGLDTGNVSMRQADQIIEGLTRKLGIMANAEELAANGQMQLAQAVTTVNARMKDSVPAHNRLGQVARQNGFVMQNLAFQLNDVVSGFAMGQRPMQIFAQQGGQIYQALSMGEGGVGGSLKSIGGLLARFAPILIPVAAAFGALALGVAGLTSAIDKNTGKSVSWGNTLKAVFQSIGDSVGRVLGPATHQIATWFGNLVQWISPGVKAGVNFIIGGYVGAFNSIKAVWAKLPAAMGDLVTQAANATIDGIEKMINGAISLLNDMIRGMNDKLGGIGVNIQTVGKVGFGDIANPFAGAASDVAGTVSEEMAKAQDVNWAGEGFGNIQRHALLNAANDNKKKGTKPKRDSFADLIQSAKGATAALQAQAAALGKTTQEAAYLEEKQKLLNRAAQAHIRLTPSQIAAIDSEAQAYGRAKAQLEAMTEVYGALKDAFTGFFADLKSNLQQGQTVWEAFGNAASNALNKIADKALDMATSGIFDMLWGGGSSSGSGLGGIISGAISGMLGGGIGGSAAPFAIGGMPMYASGTDNAPGGLAVVGERGPELVNLARGSQVFSNERSRAMLAANGNMPAITFAPVYNINGIGLSAAQLQAVLAANNASLLKQLPAIQRDQYRRAA